MLGFLGKIVSSIGQVVTTAVGIFKVAKPIIEALRPAVKEIDDVLVFMEEQVAVGGVEADDFLDRNLGTLITVETTASRSAAVLQAISEIAAELRVISQETTPDTVTPEEAASVGAKFIALRDLIPGLKADLETASQALDKVQ